MKQTMIAILFSVLMLGCSSHKVQEITFEDLKGIYDTHTTNHTVYLGSDSVYHYFSHHKPTGSKRYKMNREGIRIVDEFPLSQKAPELFFLPKVIDMREKKDIE